LYIPGFTVILGLENPNFHEIGNPLISLIQFWSQTAHILIAALHCPVVMSIRSVAQQYYELEFKCSAEKFIIALTGKVA
jgi:hypothetical protein